MKTYTGLRVFEGYAIGKIKIYHQKRSAQKIQGNGVEHEISRFKKARQLTVDYLNNLYLKMLSEIDSDKAEIFNIHKMMAEDLDLEDLVMDLLVNENVNAEYAIETAGKSLANLLEQMDDEYMKSRAADAIDVSNRIVHFLNPDEKDFYLDEPSIVLCKDIPASELVKLNKNYFLGLVCVNGSTNSHVAILSRTMEIISIASLEMEITDELDGKIAILDGSQGKIIIQPDADTLSIYNKLKQEHEEEKKKLKQLIGKEAITIDGKKIHIYANIASCFEADNVLKNDGEGVGLFRSEFLYLESNDYPSEEEQYKQYKKVVEKLNPRQVIIRTLDIGADKKVDYFNLPHEENPALGYRSIRICKDRPEVFLTQLTALYRASAHGNLAIMVPMIVNVSEVEFVKEMAKLAMANLNARNVKYNKNMKIGIMIETPAAAIIADELAKKVDFFSIGTNDLSQYTLAIDRQNPKLDSTFNPHHKAVLRLIDYVVKSAKKENIFVGICGELARDPILAPFFVKIGVDELSVSAPYILPLRKTIIEMDTTTISIEDYI